MRRKKLVLPEGEIASANLTTGFSVDWISATIKQNERAKEFNFLAAFDMISKRSPAKPLHGYDSAYRWQFGALMLWHSIKPEMGVHFILSGQALRALHENQFDAMFLLTRFVACSAKLTMIHLALDIMDSTLKPVDIYRQFMDRNFTGRAQNASVIENSFGGQTCYVGSWNSERFFRLYDKAAEQGIENMNWKRLELVLKGEYAQAFTYKFAAEHSIERALELFRGAIGAMAEFNNADWIEALRGEKTSLALPKYKERKTREWLLTQVVPAMARYVIETGDETILNDFAAEFDGAYQKALKQIK